MSRPTVAERSARNAEERGYLAALRGDPCGYCGRQGEALDHIDAAGADHWTNLASICGPCNASKGQATPLGFMGARLDQALRDLLAAEATAWRAVGA